MLFYYCVSIRRRYSRCALVTGVQTFALPIYLMLLLKVDALRLQRPVIDAGVDIQLGQALIDVIGPRLAPFLQERRGVPLAHLLSEALRPYLAHRQHDMRVGLGDRKSTRQNSSHKCASHMQSFDSKTKTTTLMKSNPYE